MKTKLKVPTNSLLDLCRFGVKSKNQQLDTAAREVLSWIVFSSLLEDFTELSDELAERAVLLEQAKADPSKFPQDMEDDEEHPDQVDDPNLPNDDPGPLSA